eukprot:Skav203997  [mRNA]  locus=scaffold1114:20328:29672:+ [translate_table: standard]
MATATMSADPIVWSAFTFQAQHTRADGASFWLSLVLAPMCFSHYHRLDSAKGEKAYWAATFSGVLHAILIVFLCVLALYDSPELMSSSNFFQVCLYTYMAVLIYRTQEGSGRLSRSEREAHIRTWPCPCV